MYGSPGQELGGTLTIRSNKNPPSHQDANDETCAGLKRTIHVSSTDMKWTINTVSSIIYRNKSLKLGHTKHSYY